ncbi:TPA: hypothetical protein ACH3X3_012645 [Trebouxia sp. C0006]
MGTIEEALVAAGATPADLDAILLKLEDPNVRYSRQQEATSYFKRLDVAILRQPPNALDVRRCIIVEEAQNLPQDDAAKDSGVKEGTANLVKEMDELRMEINELRLERQAAMQQASPLPAACWDRPGLG